jgi:hemoglobin/transferrin/lactoferrin receptor protein
MPVKAWRITGNLSSGFRAPNIDDVTKIFESNTATQRLIVPNPDLGPEYTYNFDLGFSTTIEEKVRLELTGFYTLFRNAIASAPFLLNGQDSVVYNGVMSAVYASQNINKAFLYGFNTRLQIDLAKDLSWDNTLSFTYGRYKNPDGTNKPLDHVPPLFGKSNLTYSKNKFSAEFYCHYNGWKRIKYYNPDGEDNGQYSTPDGMPSWATLNLRGSYAFTKHFMLQAGIENITDKNYRYFASGFSAPGRNFIVAVRASL